MQSDGFQQGIYMRQLYEMSPNGLCRGEGECSLVQSIGGRKREEIYLPDPSHLLSSSALSLPCGDLIPPHSWGCITQPLQQLLKKSDLMPEAWSSSEFRSAVSVLLAGLR